MKKKGITNMAASVHDRLLKRAKAEGRPFEELLQYYVMERFLYRLSCSEHADRFVLKGALMLQFRGGPLTRATKDIDLLGRTATSVSDLVNIIKGCVAVDVKDDGLVFNPANVSGEEIRLAAQYNGVRLRCNALLGSARIALQIDVGFPIYQCIRRTNPSREKCRNGPLYNERFFAPLFNRMTWNMKDLHLQFVLAFFAGWVNRSQQALIEYLKTENDIYREKLGGKRIRFTDDQRRRLAVKAKVLGRKIDYSIFVVTGTRLRYRSEIRFLSMDSVRKNQDFLFDPKFVHDGI